jgi:ADP-ribose pyrophosphatase YjhB (NUDIX family)
MPDRHADFDPDKLNARKADNCGFRFCPLCGLKLAAELLDGQNRLACADESCGYVFYQNPVPAAGAILVENDSILLVKRAHPPKVGWWCIPAGFMEWGEHPTETTVRELEEETGLKIAIDSFFEVYSGTDDPRSNCILMLYLGTILGGELRAADDALEVKWFSFDALPEKIAFESHTRALADYNQRIRNKT